MRASTAIVLTLVEPVVAALLAVVIVGERLPTLGWAGVGLIVSSLIVLTFRWPLRNDRIIRSRQTDDRPITYLVRER